MNKDATAKYYYVKWCVLSYARNHTIRKIQCCKDVPAYQIEKNDSVVFGFYLVNYPNLHLGKFYFPEYINVNKPSEEYFLYNYCYHEFETIKDGKKDNFKSSRNLKLRFNLR